MGLPGLLSWKSSWGETWESPSFWQWTRGFPVPQTRLHCRLPIHNSLIGQCHQPPFPGFTSSSSRAASTPLTLSLWDSSDLSVLDQESGLNQRFLDTKERSILSTRVQDHLHISRLSGTLWLRMGQLALRAIRVTTVHQGMPKYLLWWSVTLFKTKTKGHGLWSIMVNTSRSLIF